MRFKALDDLADMQPKYNIGKLLHFINLSNEVCEFEDTLESIEYFFDDLDEADKKKITKILNIMVALENVQIKQLSKALLKIL